MIVLRQSRFMRWLSKSYEEYEDEMSAAEQSVIEAVVANEPIPKKPGLLKLNVFLLRHPSVDRMMYHAARTFQVLIWPAIIAIVIYLGWGHVARGDALAYLIYGVIIATIYGGTIYLCSRPNKSKGPK